MATWICANCGAEHDANDPPCRQCAHEQFARLEDDSGTPETIERTGDVRYRCKQCGRLHHRNNPPCNDCGGMQFQAVQMVADSPGADADTAASKDTVSQSQGGREPTTDSTGPLYPVRYYGLRLILAIFGLAAVALGLGFLSQYELVWDLGWYLLVVDVVLGGLYMVAYIIDVILS